MTTIKLDTADGVCTLTMDLAERSMNVITPEFIAELDAAVDQISGDEGINGVILTSAKPAFLAGADLKWLVNQYESDMGPAERLAENRVYSNLLRKMETCGKPFVAALNGNRFGRGA